MNKITQLEDFIVYQKSQELFDLYMEIDSEILRQDFRGREIAKQLVRSLGSVCANIEEGFGRSFGKEFIHYLRISRGSARESKGWYLRSKTLLPSDLISKRIKLIDEIIRMLVALIRSLEKFK